MTDAHTLMGSALLLGGITAAWGRIKAMASRLLSTVVVTATIRGDAAVAMQARCWREFQRSKFGDRFYVSTRAFVRPKGRLQIVAYESLGDEPCVFWAGFKPLLVTALSGSESGAGQALIEVSFLRGTFDVELLLKESLEQLNESRKAGRNVGRRFFVKRVYGSRNRRPGGGSGKAGAGGSSACSTSVYAFDAGEARPVGWTPTELGSPLPEARNALDDLALSAPALEVVHEVRYWLKNEQRCRDQRRPWTRGILLYGKPGNGKTSLARAIAHDLDLPVFIFDLASLTNQELQDAWEAMQQHTPCIALIEDLHLVMERLRDNPADCGFTLDGLLNCMSGFEACDGVLKIGTANRLEGIDQALGIPSDLSDKTVSTRPGRFDRAIEIPSPDEPGRRKLLKVMFPEPDGQAEELVVDGADDTAAQFVERCESLARRRDGMECSAKSPSMLRSVMRARRLRVRSSLHRTAGH